MKKFIIGLVIAILFGGAPLANAGSYTTYDFFWKPDYRESGPSAYTSYNAALDATDIFLHALSSLPGLINDWAIQDQIVTMVPGTASPTYSDADTFTLTGDYTSRFPANAVVQIHVAAGMVYSTVASSSYAAPTTTVNLNNAVLTDPITRVYVVATRDGLWPNGPGYVIARDYGTSRAALEAADAVATAAGRELRITVAYAIDADVTLNSPKVTVQPGVSLAVATTKTLTITGTLNAGLYQIFSCTGTGKVVYKANKYPEWWGAKDDSGTDCTAAFNAACLNAGPVEVVSPNNGYYKITTAVALPSNTTLYGHGYQSRIHSTNTTRLSAITATGTGLAPLSNIKVKDLRITGLAGTTQGVSAAACGSGIYLTYCNDCEISGNTISEWSDEGILIIDGNRNIITNNNVTYTSQNICIAAENADVYDNVISNNVSGLTLLYTPIQLEGSWGAGAGICYNSVITGNTVYSSWERGIVAQVAPNTAITGNNVRGGGLGSVLTKLDGVHLYGAPNSSVTGNISVGNTGYGIRLGANSTSSTVSGNTTQSNSLGSCLLTDDAVASSYYVAMGINSFTEGDVAISGNVSFLNRIKSLQFANVAVADGTTLDYYKEDVFTPVAYGTTDAGAGTYTAQSGFYTRIGRVVHFTITIGWSAHTGTGNLRISGLPFTVGTVGVPVYIRNNGLAVPATEVLQGYAAQSQTYIVLESYAPATGGVTAVVLDTAVAGLYITGTYIAQ